MSAPIGRVSIKAPTLELQDQFVARLKTAIALKTFREIREAQDLRKESTSQPSGWLEGLFHKDQPEDDLSGLKDSIGEGLVFDFTPLVWEIQVTEASISAFAPAIPPYGESYCPSLCCSRKIGSP